MKEKVSYRDAIVSFIDILGFRGLVAVKSANEIHEICQLFQGQYATPNLTNSEHRSGIVRMSEIHFFSDSVVRIKYDDPPSDTAFNAATDEVMSLAHMQWNLLKRGVLVRGGVVKGPIFSDPNSHTLFGPALVEAYSLESSLAVTPRILVSGEVVHDVLSDMFSSTFCLRRDSRGNRWASKLDSSSPAPEEPWWVNYFWEPFADSLLALGGAMTANPKHRLAQKRYLESLVRDLLAVSERIADGIREDAFADERIKEKHLWIDARLTETVRDAAEWVDGFGYAKNLEAETLARLNAAASLGLNEEG